MVIIYHHSTERRKHALAVVRSLMAQGMDVNQPQNFNHPIVMIRDSWPDKKTAYNLPLSFQCEEIQFVDGDFRSVRTSIVDVEWLEPEYYI